MKWLSHPAVGAALAALLVAGVVSQGRSMTGNTTLEVVERSTLDWRFRRRHAQPVDGRLAIVTLDDATAQRAPGLIETRAGWARTIAAIKAQGASVIAIDAVFQAPEQPLEEHLGARVVTWAGLHAEEPGEGAQLLRDVAEELRGDERLTEALRAAGNVVLAVHTGGGIAHVDPATVSRARYGQSTLGEAAPVEQPSLLGSLPQFTAVARAMGFATVDEDDTHIVRRLAMVTRYQGGLYMPLSVAVVGQLKGLSRGRLSYLGPVGEVRFGDEVVQLDQDAIWLDYRAPSPAFPVWSAVDVVEGKLPPDALNGKAVLVGVTRFGWDLTRTPFGRAPGVELQATAIDNLLRGRSLVRASLAQEALAAFLVGLLIALVFAFRSAPLWAQLSGALAVAGAWVAVCFVEFNTESRWLPMVGPLLSVTLATMVGLALAYSSEVLKRRELRKAFGHYLGEDVLSELLAQPDMLKLGGERRRLTVLFSDIRDFTTLSEQLAPDKLVAVLNTYLTPMTGAVLSHRGLLDKYIGDAVMAVFGAPVPQPTHAAHALKCVLEMHRELEALNAGPLKELPLAIGVGLNTGEMVVGNMGSAERFDYTVAGDAVNLASRLEGLTKVYGVFCLVGAGTRAEGGDAFTFRTLDLVQVKGKHEPVEVFELLAGPGHVLARYEAMDAWTLGVKAFREGKLSEARAALAEFAQKNAGEVVVQRYLEQLAALPAEAPPGWTPVTVFSTK